MIKITLSLMQTFLRKVLILVKNLIYNFRGKNQVSGNNKFSVILRFEMILSVMSYERKNIIFYGRNLKFTKKNTFDHFFVIEFFSYYRFIQIFQKSLDFHKLWLIFS